MAPLTLRVRSQIGTWRVNNVSPTDDFRMLRERLQKEHNADFQRSHDSFSMDAGGKVILRDNQSILEAGLKNGDMIYTLVDDGKVGIHEASTLKKAITKDGRIVAQHADQAIQASGFRPGMLPLRSMKMNWTLDEFIRLDEQFVYKIKAQEKSNCSTLSVNADSLQNFQSYMRSYDYRVIRIAYMYGRINEDKSVKVETIYEPPQNCTEVSFTLLPDPQAESVEKISAWLGLKKVGWVFAHPPREKGFFFSGPEILFTAEQQLEAANGVGETPFVTVKVTLDDKGQSVVEAFQVSQQCMEMVAEGVLEISTHLGSLKVNPTFTAVVEGKNTTEVDNSFFLVSTPIKPFTESFLVCTFPRANRIEVQTRDHLKLQLSKVGKQGWTLIDLIADLELLLFLSRMLSLDDDISLLCQSIVDRDVVLNEGYELLIRSIAGID